MGSYYISSTAKGWELRKEGARRPSKTAPTKEEIIELAQAFMESKAGTVKVQTLTGDVEQELTYH
ncbi:DUF2188 domain-containing protein [Aquipseudomonas ullengensis]|uniref:DUF2188 domain-containing protein n=1 Tax=Aquipseudomonas ullengensis TaxID=2759166 RepID=A0A7W4LN05_9GAMM|nr:DUF2188 domain-containing protein [Pseudomonas ullengensis]MBB2496027.1 DUF2188 domain-containing protein [Pseudomonas ullengensis]